MTNWKIDGVKIPSLPKLEIQKSDLIPDLFIERENGEELVKPMDKQNNVIE